MAESNVESNINNFIVLKQSPSKGLGLFARGNIPAGTVILSEKPLFTIPWLPGQVNHNSLEQAVATLETDERIAFYKLHAKEQYPSGFTKGGIWAANAMQFGEHGAIFKITSRFNHSCAPNVSYNRNERKDVLDLRTTHDVIAGEELTITYHHRAGFTMTQMRQERLRNQYGFMCSCSACVQPRKELSDMRCMLITGISIALTPPECCDTSMLLAGAGLSANLAAAKLPRYAPPRLHAAYSYIMVELVKAEDHRDLRSAEFFRRGAMILEYQNGQHEEKLSRAALRYVAYLYKLALEIYEMFGGLHDAEISNLREKIKVVETLI